MIVTRMHWTVGSLAILIAVGTLAVGASATAPKKVGARVSLKTSHNLTRYKQPKPASSHLSGVLSTHKRGVKVVLIAQRWPFHHAPRQLSTTKTGKKGRYAFRVHAVLATVYQVVVPSLGIRSAKKTVHVLPGYKDVVCAITGHGQRFPCHIPGHIEGRYTLHFSYTEIFPPEAYPTEKTKATMVYYGRCDGCKHYPSSLNLVGRAKLHPRPGATSRVIIKRPISISRTGFKFYLSSCLQLSEQVDGLGLPGPPGSHHCGDKVITLREAHRATLS